MPTTPLKAILWDNDGVLVDTEHLYFEATREVFREQGVDLTLRHYFDGFLRDSCGSWHLLDCDEATVAALREERNRRYLRKLQQAPDLEIPGIRRVLETLAPHLRMGVVTSSRREDFDAIHARLPLLQHVEFVLAEGDYARSKPAPDPYLAGLERLGLPASQCVAVEDSPRGLLAAQTAGLECILMRSRLTEGFEMPPARYVVDEPAELLDLLTSLGAEAAR